MLAVGNLYWQLEKTQTELSNLRFTTQSEVTKLSEATHKAANRKVIVDPNRKMLESLKEELSEQLKSTKTEAAVVSQHAREAVNHANRLASKLSEENRNQHKEVIGELGHLKEIEATANARVNTVTADVMAIKSDVADARQELKQTVSDLKQVIGDLGVQSGFIATNARELQQLKLRGERNYFDFHLMRTGKPQRVGNVYVVLRKTDPKNGHYTLDVLADDRVTQKRDRSIHEPVQFYVSKGRNLYEIVVNEIQKDYVIGYLATPKELIARSSY